MQSESRFDEIVLFHVGETEFEQEGARVDVCTESGSKGKSGEGGVEEWSKSTVDVLQAMGDESLELCGESEDVEHRQPLLGHRCRGDDGDGAGDDGDGARDRRRWKFDEDFLAVPPQSERLR
jgi:hypothetical protein